MIQHIFVDNTQESSLIHIETEAKQILYDDTIRGERIEYRLQKIQKKNTC